MEIQQVATQQTQIPKPKMPLGFKIILVLLLISIFTSYGDFGEKRVFFGFVTSETFSSIITFASILIALILIYGIVARQRFAYYLALIFYGYGALDALTSAMLSFSPGYRSYLVSSFESLSKNAQTAEQYPWLVILGSGIPFVISIIIFRYIYKNKSFFIK